MVLRTTAEGCFHEPNHTGLVGLRASAAGHAIVRSLLSAVLAMLIAGPAQAIVNVGAVDNDEEPVWWDGDPGWDSVTISGAEANYTYLGDNWVIAARHTTGYPASQPFPARFATGTYASIPGQAYIVPNPTTGWTPPLTTQSDVILVRIKGDPGGDGVPPVALASQPPPVNGEVVFIGEGYGRSTNVKYWQVDTSDPDNWTWTLLGEVPGGNFHGYTAGGSSKKRWGTNKIADDQALFQDNDTNWNGVFRINNRDTISLITRFDETGGTQYESQALGGDSGTSVFYKRGGQWELAGVVNSVYDFQDQSSAWAVFPKSGPAYWPNYNHTTFADISSYYPQIMNIMSSHSQDFTSVMGDVNLDGSITYGTGNPATDDVQAFVNGWGYTGSPGITTWQKGDLNLDGTTDVADFLLMRGALNGAGAGSLASLLGVGSAAVPEPSSAAIVFAGASLAALRLRRWRRVAV